MFKWYPSTESAIYVFPDIHGMLYQLNLFIPRIFPLRKTCNYKDTAIFLGDYIDRSVNSHLVIDRLIEIKGENTIFLKGNHEDLLLKAIAPNESPEPYMTWMANGGDKTLLGYIERSGEDIKNPYLVNRHRIKDFIPKEHIDFFNDLKMYHETDDYIFVHAGIDTGKPLEDQASEMLLWDRELHKFVIEEVGFSDPPWTKTIVCGHNNNYEGIPTIRSKYMMLDCSCIDRLYCVELTSLEAFYAQKGNKKLVKFELEES